MDNDLNHLITPDADTPRDLPSFDGKFLIFRDLSSRKPVKDVTLLGYYIDNQNIWREAYIKVIIHQKEIDVGTLKQINMILKL